MSTDEKNLAEVLEKIASMDEPQRTEMQRVQGFIMTCGDRPQRCELTIAPPRPTQGDSMWRPSRRATIATMTAVRSSAPPSWR